MKKQIIKIGVVGVDSGQLVITDPCYIDSSWKHEEFTDIRRYKHKDGAILQYQKDFSDYETIIPKYGKTIDQLHSDKEVKKMEQIPAKENFSYNSCCKLTLGKDKGGQINYELGHPGLAVAFFTGYGDGVYPVIAEIVDGRIKKITIKFF